MEDNTLIDIIPHTSNDKITTLSLINPWSQDVLMWTKFPQLLSINRLASVHELQEVEGLDQISCDPIRSVDEDINRKVSLWFGDITLLEVDFIVNSAHYGLLFCLLFMFRIVWGRRRFCFVLF
eukprot:TRINITY_DN3798_c0_g1_i2.p1 TRINITY_DN3798_c0_g1~~TRINITY_DN3798_c0_g1_i2.p1  ORF type:complete len:123 (-),score=17.71 TRINITY_DN3798_c0_g1_i2:495-863(-)